MNKMKSFFGSLMALATMFAITACSGNDEVYVDKNDATTTVKLNIATASIGTRAATEAVKAGNGTLTESSSDEAKLNNLYVGVFDASGNKLYYKAIASPSTTISSGTITETIGTIKAMNTSVSKIVVVANAPSSTFTGSENYAAFKANVANLSYTTSADGTANTNANTVNSQEATSLPMYGETSTINTATANVASATVTLTRLVARVNLTINGVNVSDATFSPNEIYMYNPTTSMAWDASTINYAASADNGAESTEGTTSLANKSTLSSTAYLSTGLINNGKTAFADLTTKSAHFYVMPNPVSNTTYPTKIIVKGIWHNTSAGTDEVVYYPITIKHNNGDKKILANTRYSINVTINGKGSDSPASEVETGITTDIQVNAWDDSAIQNETFQ